LLATEETLFAGFLDQLQVAIDRVRPA
jgi:hypothetical protein